MAPTKKDTPPTWKEEDDANKKGHEYPNYFIWQTRTGHVPIRVDDTKGNESISYEHRSGTKMSFLPSGEMKFVANYGRTDITYGQSRSKITGAQDATVDGDSSVLTKGTRRITNGKDVEESTTGKVVSTAQSYNMSAGQQFDIAAQSAALKTKNGLTMESGDGPVSITAKGSVTLQSKGGSVGMEAVSGSAAIQALVGDIVLKAQEVHIAGGAASIVLKGSEVHIKAGSAEIVLNESGVHINEGIAKIAKTTEEGWMEGDPAPAETPPPTPLYRGTQLRAQFAQFAK